MQVYSTSLFQFACSYSSYSSPPHSLILSTSSFFLFPFLAPYYYTTPDHFPRHYCTITLPGTYASGSATVECLECQRGKDSAVGSPGCFYKCEMGDYVSFNATNNVTTCPICPAGRFNHVVGGALNVSGCLGCPRGFYCRGGREKQACHAGTYSNATFLEHAEQCEKCPRGTYSPATALTSAHQCNKCPTGRVGNISGLTASDHCTPTEAG